MRIQNIDRFFGLGIIYGGLFRTKRLPGVNELRRAGLTYPSAKKLLELLKTVPATPDIMIEEGSVDRITPEDLHNKRFTMWDDGVS